MNFEIFADETHIKDKNGKEFLGIGCLFVPTENKNRLVKRLCNLRCLNENSKVWTWQSCDCRHNCKYHGINDFEIHSTKIENGTSKTKIRIYRRWVNFITNHNRHIQDKDKLLYFNILYLDLDKLDFDIFGVDKDTTNIYSRFFKSVILSARSFYFKNKDFTIKEIYHDIADEKESHDYFYRQAIDSLITDERINVLTNRIKFIDSNHKNHGDVEGKCNAHMIQLIDLILGCCNQILFRTSSCENRNKVAGDFYPLFREMWLNPYDYGNQFNYFKSQQVQIFPKTTIKSQYDLDGELDGIAISFIGRLKFQILEIRLKGQLWMFGFDLFSLQFVNQFQIINNIHAKYIHIVKNKCIFINDFISSSNSNLTRLSRNLSLLLVRLHIILIFVIID